MKPNQKQLQVHQNEPFGVGRDPSRLLFDFAIGLSFMDSQSTDNKVLDIACGTGWTSELLARAGWDVTAFDIDEEVIEIAKTRLDLDPRISNRNLRFFTSDIKDITQNQNEYSYSFCFDSLHHFADYKAVLQKLHTILKPGGKAIFIEPGSRHSKSPETVKFLKDHNHAHDEYWYEKDVDLKEVAELGNALGFSGIEIKPYNYPSTVGYTFTDWYNILDNTEGRNNYFQEFRRFNFEDRVIFALTK